MGMKVLSLPVVIGVVTQNVALRDNLTQTTVVRETSQRDRLRGWYSQRWISQTTTPIKNVFPLVIFFNKGN